jgi:hypothetical protein
VLRHHQSIGRLHQHAGDAPPSRGPPAAVTHSTRLQAAGKQQQPRPAAAVAAATHLESLPSLSDALVERGMVRVEGEAGPSSSSRPATWPLLLWYSPYAPLRPWLCCTLAL